MPSGCVGRTESGRHVMHRKGTSVTAVIGAALVVVLAATAAVPATASRDSRAGRQAAARVPNDRSGLPWASGVLIPWAEPANYEAFGAWRGAAPDVALLYGARETWDQIVKPTWLPNWNKTAFTLVISTGMLPEEGGTLAECAARRLRRPLASLRPGDRRRRCREPHDHPARVGVQRPVGALGGEEARSLRPVLAAHPPLRRDRGARRCAGTGASTAASRRWA